MTAELAIRTGLPGTLRADGYDLPPDLTYEEWRGVLALTEHIHAASPWWLGDALVYGEQRFPDRHSQALPTPEDDPDGARQSRMRSAVWVSSKFPPVTRVTSLSWSHHRAVAELDLDEASALLRAAEREKLPTRKLIERAQARQDQLRGRTTDEPEDGPLPMPTRADLTDEALAALTYRLSGMGARHRLGFEAGWLQALVWNGADDCFKEPTP